MLLLPGCSSSGPNQSTPGGMQGEILMGQESVGVSELQVNAFQHREGTHERVGVGITGVGGKFSLLTPDGSMACYLTPGDYVFTVESVAADPIELPPSVRDSKTTILKQSVISEKDQLMLFVPYPL